MHPSLLFKNGKNILDEFHDLKLSFIEIFRETLNLPKDAIFEYPTFKPTLPNELRNKIEQFAPLDKIALLVPEAFASGRIAQNVLEDEVEALKKEGLVVISNVINKNLAIKGSIYVPLSVDEAVILALYCKKVITVRSGFSDIIIPFLDEITIFYANLKDYYKFSLNRLKGRRGFEYLKNKEIKEIIFPDSYSKKLGRLFQFEQKNGERLIRFCITLFKTREFKDRFEYVFLIFRVLVIKKLVNCRKFLLFGRIPIYTKKNK